MVVRSLPAAKNRSPASPPQRPAATTRSIKAELVGEEGVVEHDTALLDGAGVRVCDVNNVGLRAVWVYEIGFKARDVTVLAGLSYTELDLLEHARHIARGGRRDIEWTIPDGGLASCSLRRAPHDSQHRHHEYYHRNKHGDASHS